MTDYEHSVPIDVQATNTQAIAKLAREGQYPELEAHSLLPRQIAVVRRAGEAPELIELPPPNRRMMADNLEAFEDAIVANLGRRHGSVVGASHDEQATPAVFVGRHEATMVFDTATGYETLMLPLPLPRDTAMILEMVDRPQLNTKTLVELLRYDWLRIAPPGLEKAIGNVAWRDERAASEQYARGKESLGGHAGVSVTEDTGGAVAPIQKFAVPYSTCATLTAMFNLDVHVDPIPADRTWLVRVTTDAQERFWTARQAYLCSAFTDLMEPHRVPVIAGTFRT